MSRLKYGKGTALKEFMVGGNPITILEAVTIFGVPHLPRYITDLRRQGWLIKSRKIAYAEAVKRVNQYISLIPPKDLPIADILVTEYWVST